jgi:RNA polymerase primary sigma factor
MSVAALRRGHHPPRTAVASIGRARAERSARSSAVEAGIRRLLTREIDFIPNPSFCTRGAEAAILGRRAAARHSLPASAWPGNLPSHLARLCETELLSAEVETDLFRRMNYLKFRACRLRAQLDPKRPRALTWRAAERFLAEALVIRNQIIQANTRLVISIVKQFVGPQHSFDDLLSVGLLSLMRAVEKFDYARGFRFSTYAYRAILRDAYRTVGEQQQEYARCTPASEEILDTLTDERDGQWLNEQTWNRLRTALAGLLEKLDRRERFIVRARFALGAHRRVRTFQQLAQRLGVSKERVRQLEQRALAKLRQMASAEVSE